MPAPVYADNPTVRQAYADGLQRPLPPAFYLDGVQYQAQAAGRADTVLGLWVINMLSGRRHLVSALKGLDQCGCGCR
eukprot:6954662-Pyramimonas_sp.AAC.1